MIYCVYSKTTGEIRSRFETSPSDSDHQLVNEDEAIYVGDADPRLHRIDPQSGIRVEFSENDGRVWDRAAGEWIGLAESKRRRARDGRLKIKALESRQARAIRELLLNPASAEARSRLEEIELQIAQQRPVVNGETETTALEAQNRSPRDPS
jgi:hypothetical protein